MTRFVVWSTHVDYRAAMPRARELVPVASRDVIELSRTDRKVAEEDAALIRDLFKRKAWVQEETR